MNNLKKKNCARIDFVEEKFNVKMNSINSHSKIGTNLLNKQHLIFNPICILLQNVLECYFEDVAELFAIFF